MISNSTNATSFPTKKILFIKGFNTCSEQDNIYFAFDIYKIANKNINIEYFNYEPTEDIIEVYERLSYQITTNIYNILISHSLGGGLLLKFCKENETMVLLFEKVIFLMPYIYTNPYSLIHITSKMNISCLKNVSIPQYMISNNNNHSNTMGFITLKQIFQVHQSIFLPIPEIIETFQKHKNIFFIYAKNEKISVIDTFILEKIPKIIYVDGTHTCFCELNNHSIFFFNLLHSMLDNNNHFFENYITLLENNHSNPNPSKDV
jgi:hypothetical protein